MDNINGINRSAWFEKTIGCLINVCERFVRHGVTESYPIARFDHPAINDRYVPCFQLSPRVLFLGRFFP
jgi:hypothetical protein